MAVLPTGLAQVVERCAWCGVGLASHARVVIAGGRFAGRCARFEELRGHIVQVRTAHGPERVTAIVPLPDTRAHTAGYDLLFVLCSLACRDALDRAIGDDAMVLSVLDARPKRRVRRGTAATTPRASDSAPPALLRRRPS